MRGAAAEDMGGEGGPGPLERVLREDGEPLGDAPDQEGAASLFAHLARVRAVDLGLVALQRAGELPFYSSALGAEGVTCGAPSALAEADAYFPGPRTAVGALVRGVSLTVLASQVLGSAGSPTRGRVLPNHLSARERGVVSVSGIHRAGLTHAAGWGWAARLRGEPKAALCMVEGSAFATGDFHNAMNFAGVGRAAVVFVCLVDPAASLALATATETLAEKGVAYGVPARRVDGRDALAVQRATAEALAVARAGGGPTLLEVIAPTAAASEDGALTLAESACPIGLLGRHLERAGVAVAELRASIEADAATALRAAIEAARAQGAPARATLFDDVYAAVPDHLAAERDRAP